MAVTVLGFVTRFVGEREGSLEEAGGMDGRGGRPPTRLYECPECESVYLSEYLETCRSCRTAVEPVPSERDLGYGSARSR